MGSTGNAIQAGKAEVTLGLNRNPLEKGLAEAQAKLQAFGSQLTAIGAGITAVGAAIAAPLIAASKTFADFGSSLNDAAAQTGASAQALAVLDYAASQTGATFEQVVSAFGKLNKNLSGIDEEAKATHSALSALGLSVKELRNLKPDQQFGRIADRLANVETAADRTRIAMALFGKGGFALLPLLSGGAAGLDDFAKRAAAMGLVLDDKAVGAADTLGDAIDDVQSAFKGASVQLGAAFAPALTGVANIIRDTISQVTEWITANQDLVQGIGAAAAITFAAGTAITAVGVAFVAAGAAIGGITTVFSAVVAAIAAIASPIGVLTVALAAGGAAFVRFATTGNDAFIALGDTATSALGGIRDAIAAGDLTTAWEIVTTSVTLLWNTTLNALLNAWNKVTTALASTMIDVTAALQSSWVDFTAFFSAAWSKTIEYAFSAWEAFTGGLRNTWNSVATYLTKTLNYIRGVFDDTFDVKKANEAADALFKERQAASANRVADAFAEANAAQQTRSAEIEENRKKRQAEIAAFQTGTQGQLDDMASAAANPLADKLDALNATLATQTAKAQAARQQIAELDAKSLEARADVVSPVGSDAAKLTTQGTFNAFAVAGFAANPALDRTAKATEETARLLKRMSQKETDGIVLA